MPTSESKRLKKKISSFFPILIQFIIGVAFGVFGMSYIVENLPSFDFSLVEWILLVSLVIVGWFLNINLHEFGHFLFGKLSGYRLLSFRVGLFSWDYENGKMKFAFKKNEGYSGLCMMIPPVNNQGKWKDLAYYSGGIVLNVLTGIVSFLIASLVNGPIIFLLFLYFLGGSALLLAVVNLVPFMSQQLSTDGKLIWGIILGRPFAERLIEVNKIASLLSVGVRPKELPISLDGNVENLDLYSVTLFYYEFIKAIDEPNMEKIITNADIMEQNVEIFPPLMQPAIYYDLCFVGCLTGDDEKAKLYYEKSGKTLQKDQDCNGLRVKAYYEFYMNNNTGEARRLANEALEVIELFPLKGQAIMEEDLVKKLVKNIGSLEESKGI
ncbi:M50 family metallopeptidase [Salipaludibacillus sp. HK11]|uniref:M50 family metallopeptidase n=1 Tax=Salipaludibacillus sp. HK11 TaxID=3394320 RepID=UPI0039FBC935